MKRAERHKVKPAGPRPGGGDRYLRYPPPTDSERSSERSMTFPKGLKGIRVFVFINSAKSENSAKKKNEHKVVLASITQNLVLKCSFCNLQDRAQVKSSQEPKMNRSRGWCFTLNNYSVEEEETIRNAPCAYMLFGKSVVTKEHLISRLCTL